MRRRTQVRKLHLLYRGWVEIAFGGAAQAMIAEHVDDRLRMRARSRMSDTFGVDRSE